MNTRADGTPLTESDRLFCQAVHAARRENGMPETGDEYILEKLYAGPESTVYLSWRGPWEYLTCPEGPTI